MPVGSMSFRADNRSDYNASKGNVAIGIVMLRCMGQRNESTMGRPVATTVSYSKGYRSSRGHILNLSQEFLNEC